MTKFEEEFKALTSWDWINIDLIQQILTKFGNLHSDEQFQKLLEQNADWSQECKNINQINSQLTKENEDLKSQLQQQALPVVKDFVAEWYEEHKADLDFSIFEACVSLYDDNSSDFKKWFGNSENKSIETLVRMKNGYQVEKPQLFYLKHIDMSKRNSINDLYLKKYIHADLTENGEHRLSHAMSAKGIYPSKEYCAFTQQEIDSMQTGSYEQIEVDE